MDGWMVNGWVGAGCLDQSFLPRTGPASTSKTGWSCRRPPPSEPPPWQETEESPLSFFHSQQPPTPTMIWSFREGPPSKRYNVSTR